MMKMQWILFVIGYIVLVAAAAARKVHNDGYHSPSHYLIPFDDVYGIEDFRHGADEPKIISKRALSVLSRWKPFGNLGVRMNSIHKHYPPSRRTLKMSHSPGIEYSAESEGAARPMGQPLRWGRKR